MLPISPGLIVSKSKTGKGIFTTKRYAKDVTLFRVEGPFVSGDSNDDMEDSVRDNMFRYDADRYISPAGTIGDYLNHSCSPNAKIKKQHGKLFVVSLRTISRDTEVTIDYSTITAMDDSWSMRCRCGSPTCRRIIRSFTALPEPLKRSYVRRYIVPAYILSIDQGYAG